MNVSFDREKVKEEIRTACAAMGTSYSERKIDKMLNNYVKFLNGLNDEDYRDYLIHLGNLKYEELARATDAVRLDTARINKQKMSVNIDGRMVLESDVERKPPQNKSSNDGFEEEKNNLPSIDDIYYRD